MSVEFDSGMGFTVSLSDFPDCSVCGRNFAEEEERRIVFRNSVPKEKQYQRSDGKWAYDVEDGMEIMSVEAQHVDCPLDAPA